MKITENSIALPLMPAVHQAVDAVYSTSKMSGTYRGHNMRVRDCYHLSNHTQEAYRTAKIKKRDGTFRELNIPTEPLMATQRRILCEILSCFPISPFATAYRPGANLRDGTAPHVGKKVLLKLDIQSFFSHITFQMVLSGAFNETRFPKPVGVMLANLCCYRGHLPQGAPTSPAISNVVMRPFDDYMGDFCAARDISYTRYCDDMSFSGDFEPSFLLGKVSGSLSAMGFRLNNGKTQVLRQGQRQMITGIVVNEKQQLPQSYRKSIRQALYYCNKHGVWSHILQTKQEAFIAYEDGTDEVCYVDQAGFLRHLLGRISHALSVNPCDAEMQSYRDQVRELSKGGSI